MKQRATYLLPEGSDPDPSNIEIGKDKLTFRKAHLAALERRFTIGLHELPKDLSSSFEEIQELHIRWVSPRDYTASSPLVSRLPPGLHARYIPANPDTKYSNPSDGFKSTLVYDRDGFNICPLLRDLFDKKLKCRSVPTSFSRARIEEELLASSSIYQFFHSLPKLLHFQASLSRKVCKMDSTCIGQVATLGSANYLDIDFDATSKVVTLNGFWAAGTPGSSSQGTIEKLRKKDKVEVGVLQPEKAASPDELKVGGRLTILGDDEKPSGTLFAFPSRHHPLPAGSDTRYSVSFQTPTGLHPKLEIKFPAKDLAPPKESCALNAYFTLPSGLFIDRYQFSDPLFLASQKLVSLRSLTGEDDLEAPDWVVKQWGSAALLELAHPESSTETSETDWIVTIPTHLRYLSSSLSASNESPEAQGQETLDIPWPSAFWACEADEESILSDNPFDRTNLGYDGLFSPNTTFHHIPPQVVDGKDLIEQLSVPVLDANNAALAENATLAVVALGFTWICWKLLTGSPKGGAKKKSKSKGK